MYVWLLSHSVYRGLSWARPCAHGWIWRLNSSPCPQGASSLTKYSHTCLFLQETFPKDLLKLEVGKTQLLVYREIEV